MSKVFSVAAKIVAEPGSEGDVVMHVVEAARVFTLKQILVGFPAGQNFDLEISIFKGINKIAPSRGVYQGNGFVIMDLSDERFQSGERIIAHFKNNNTTNAQSCFILLTGEIE
ncbi:hypothetical protein [Thermosphaera sp.]